MEIKFFNIKTPEEFSNDLLPEEDPGFLSYSPDFTNLDRLAEKFQDKTNVLVIGHGGSITSFYAVYESLKSSRTKDAYFLWTVDPDYISELKARLSPENTVVVAISKSGKTITQIEALSQFLNYQGIVVSEANTPLSKIGEKLGWEFLVHPTIGGRFTGFTEVTLLPSMLCGLDVKSYLSGGKQILDQYKTKNLAKKLASSLWSLEQQGFVDVFGFIYSHSLSASSTLIMQLAHESFGKNNYGQTFTMTEAPESQHHSLQRYLGGLKNMVGLFVTIAPHSTTTSSVFPANLQTMDINNKHLADFTGLSLGHILQIEALGNIDHATKTGIPVIHLELSGLEALQVGKWVAFWQLFAVYSACLRKVNPFDQPEVEYGKKIAFNLRLKAKGLD